MYSELPVKIEICDDLSGASSSAIEVLFELTDGRRRWCFFMTPAALANAGDWIPGTRIRFHFGAPHMIVVSDISEDVIRRVIHHLAREGVLERCSRSVED